MQARQVHGEARQLACGLRGLHAVPAHAGVAFDQEADVAIEPPRRFGEAARHGLVVEHDGEAPDTLVQREKPLRLPVADDIVGEQDVAIDAGVGEDLDLPELLAGDAARAGVELHLADRRNLVGLDVRPVGDATLVELGLHAADIRFEPVEVDGDGRRVERCDEHGWQILKSDDAGL